MMSIFVFRDMHGWEANMVPGLLILHWERLDKRYELLKRVPEGRFVSRTYVWFDKDAAGSVRMLESTE